MLCFAALAIAFVSVLAHDEKPKTPEQIRVYQDLEAAAYYCAPAVAVYTAERKRAFAQKVLGGTPNGAAYRLAAGNLFGNNPDEEAQGGLFSCNAADDLEIRNNTCVLAPEVTAGPYHSKYEHPIRNNIAEYEPGLLMLYNIGVIDVETCEPVPNVLVDIWQANATGYYSGYPGPEAMLVNEVPAQSGRRKGLLSPYPKTEGTDTTLRGAWPTDKNGVASFTSIFPGYYTGRATHVHVKVHPEWSPLPNGTFVPSRLVHVGQFFFEDDLNMAVDKVWPYNLNPVADKVGRTRNWDDGLNIFDDAQIGGYKSIFETYLLGGVLQQGLVGYITMAVNMSASLPDFWQPSRKDDGPSTPFET